VDESISNQQVKSEETMEAHSPLRTQAITTDEEIGIQSAAPAALDTTPLNYGSDNADEKDEEVIEIPDRPLMIKSKKYSHDTCRKTMRLRTTFRGVFLDAAVSGTAAGNPPCLAWEAPCRGIATAVEPLQSPRRH